MEAWINNLFQSPELLDMGHSQRQKDANLGLGWLYYALARLIRPRTVVVIGSWRGFAPLVFAKGLSDNLEGGEVLFIDPSFVDDFWRDPESVSSYFGRFGATNIRHYLATTEQFVETATYNQLSDIGLVFIDGHHSYEQVRFDFEAFEGRLASDGVILLHDSAKVDVSLMYGLERAYAYQVKFFVDDLRCRRDLSVFEISSDPGLTLVSKQSTRQLTNETEGGWLRKGAALFNAGQGAEAAACFGRAVRLEPANGSRWMLNGWALFTAGAIGEALECFEMAQRLGHQQAGRAVAMCGSRASNE